MTGLHMIALALLLGAGICFGRFGFSRQSLVGVVLLGLAVAAAVVSPTPRSLALADMHIVLVATLEDGASADEVSGMAEQAVGRPPAVGMRVDENRTAATVNMMPDASLEQVLAVERRLRAEPIVKDVRMEITDEW